jgi:hypothetical protein
MASNSSTTKKQKQTNKKTQKTKLQMAHKNIKISNLREMQIKPRQVFIVSWIAKGWTVWYFSRCQNVGTEQC